MGNFKINDRSCKKEADWYDLKDLTLGMNPSAKTYFDDNIITPSELNSMLDVNQDQEITCTDFKGLKPELFEKMTAILQRHNYNLPEECEGTYDRWADREYVLATIKHTGNFAFALAKADESLKKDRKFILSILTILKQNLNNPAFQKLWVFSFIDVTLMKDKKFVLDTVTIHGEWLQYANESLKKDKDIALAALENDELAYKYIDKSLMKDNDVILALIKYNGIWLDNADDSLKKVRKVVLTAVKQNGAALRVADKMFISDREVALEAVKDYNAAFEWVDKSLQEDIEFISEGLGLKVFTGYFDFSNEIKQKVWEKILILYNSRLLKHFDKAELESFDTFRKAIGSRYNIEFLQRFPSSVEFLLDVLDKRKDPVTRNGRSVIVIYPKQDWNGGFAESTLLGRLKKLGFDVMYYEAKNEDEARLAMEFATKNGGHKVDVVVLGGHGDSICLALGGDDPARKSLNKLDELYEELYIDTNDFPINGDPDIDFSKYIIPNGDLILDSCSNGEGREKNGYNLANTIAAKNKGLRIQSIDRPAYNVNLYLENGSLMISPSEKDSVYPPTFNLGK